MLSIAGYTISSTIHEGTRSLVCRGIRNVDKMPVVLKILNSEYPSPEELARFRQEYEITKNLKLDEVIQVYALENYKQSLAIVMEDFGGISLAEILRSQKLSVSEFLDLALKICRIIGKVHQQHVMHKDLNPSNILLQHEQDQYLVKIIDFGIAAKFSYEESELPAKSLEGTLAYIAPEQTGRMNRSIDYRSDFYSLGVTFYEMLIGFLPFQSSDTIELVHCHLAKAPRPPHEVNQQIPKPVSDIIMKLMAKTAEERYQSISGLMSDLNKCHEQLSYTGQIQYVAIGQDDVAESFHIPRKLYGREQSLQDLLEEFSEIKQGTRRCVLVTGYSGIGKSELVQALQTPVSEQQGYFISGRFERFKKHVQYSAILQALQDLFQQILAEDDARLQRWKEKLAAVLGENAQILIDLAPELEIILGSQHKAPSLSSTEARKRVQRILLDVLPLFGNAERPLLLFLDNLHWSDSLSAGLLQQLLSRPEMQHFMMIGAYRDHEVEADHPLATLLAGLRREELPLREIELAPLSLADLSRLLADTLNDSKETLFPLAKLVLEKTGGNPLAVREFLKLIHTERLLTFDLQSGHWQWSLDQIQGMSMTENVVEFMAAKIQKLPLSTQRFLQCAACIGNRCDLHMIAAVMECAEAEAVSELDRVIHEGFLLPADESYQYMKFFNPAELKEFAPHVVYNFAHNRFQEDALALLPQEELGRFHLQIGRHLLDCDLHQSSGENAIADIAAHLNLGAEFIDAEEEKVQLLQFNLTVGQHAKAEGDYHAARHYLLQGMRLLNAEDWDAHSTLTFSMYRERAEIEYLSGDFGESERLIFESISHSRSSRDKTELFQLLIMQYTLRGQYREALDAGRAALKLLNVELPGPKQQAAWNQELNALMEELQGRDAASLHELPKISDSRKQQAMQIVLRLLPAASQCAPQLYHLLRIDLMKDSLAHGLCPDTPVIFAHFGSLLASSRGNYVKGYAFGSSGLELGEQFQDPAQTSRVSLILASELCAWVQPLQQAHRFEHDAYHKAVESREFLCAGQALMHRVLNLFYEGANLEQLMDDLPEFLDFSLQRHNLPARDFMLGCGLVFSNLRGLSPKIASFDTAELREEQFFEECKKRQSVMTDGIFQIMKAQALYLYNFTEKALDCLRSAEASLELMPNSICRVAHLFYDSLCVSALHPGPQDASWERLARNLRQMQSWAEQCPENFRHLALLLQAEESRLKEEPFPAMQFYQHAIEAADSQESAYHSALAHELAARFYLDQHFLDFAEFHLKKAHHKYSLWGSPRKASELAEHFPRFLRNVSPEEREKFPVPVLASSTSLIFSQGEAALSLLDLNTVMKASQAISGEIVLENLLRQMMKIVIENAGAQKGWLVLKKNDDWVVEAEGGVEREDIAVLQSIPVNTVGTMQASPVPATIIHYVIRSGEALVLHDAAREGKFTYDPHIVKHQVKSLLCLPLIKGAKMSGIIYLENNLTQGVFSQDRLHMLKILSSQMVVSLENARLYKELNESLEHQVELSNKQVEVTKAYSRFVPGELLSLLGKKSIVDVQLGEQVEKEITVMFSDIRGFTHMSEQMNPQENFNFINSYLYHMSPIIKEHFGFIDKYIGDAIMALFPTTADDAVRASIAMLEKLKVYNQGRKRAGYRPIQIGIGLNTGNLMLGTVGDQQRMDGTVISDAVNLASRIESMTKTYGVSLLISETTYFQLENSSDYAIRIIDQVQAKGKSEPVTVFEVFNADPPNIIESKLKTMVLFRQGFKLYHRTKFAEAHALFDDVLEADPEEKNKHVGEAKELFEEILHVNPHDKVAQIYLQRCEKILKYGVLDEWAGVWSWVETLKKQ